MVAHLVLHIIDIIVKHTDLIFKFGNVSVHFSFSFYEIFNDLVIILCKEPIDLILLESQPIHIFDAVIHPTVE